MLHQPILNLSNDIAVPVPPQNGRRFQLRWDGSINLGMLIHLVFLLAAAFMVWHTLDARQQGFQQQLDQLTQVTISNARAARRVELYLAMKDPTYWKKVNEIPNDPPAALPDRK